MTTIPVFSYNGAVKVLAVAKRCFSSSRSVSSFLWAQDAGELPESKHSWTSFT